MYDAAYLSALSALAGSLVGGLTSGITTWLSVRDQARSGRLAHQLSQRDELYKDFIIASSKIYGDAMLTNEPQMQDLVGLYSMISRMRVLSSTRTVACAQGVVEATVDTYFGPNKTIRELRELIKSGAGIDPLKDFSEAAREETAGAHLAIGRRFATGSSPTMGALINALRNAELPADGPADA